MTTPSQTVSAPSSGNTQPDHPSFWVRTATFISREWRWLIILVAYVLAWWLPIEWSWDTWGNPRDPMMMQLWVPLLASTLAWSRRNEISTAIKRVQESRPRNFWTRGNSIPLIIGCLIVVFGHIVHIKGIAILGLVLIAWGTVYALYGMPVVKAAFVPLAFLILTIPPPDSIIYGISKITVRGSVTTTSLLFSLMHIPTQVDPRGFIRFKDTGDTVELRETVSLLGILLPALTLILWFALLRRYPVKKIVSVLTLGTILGIVIGLIQCLLITMVHRFNPKLSDDLMAGGVIRHKYFMGLDGNFQFSGLMRVFWEIGIAWFWVLFAFGLTAWIANRRQATLRAEQLARPAGTAVSSIGNFISFLLSPIMLLFTLLGKTGKLFTRMERGTEKMLSKMTRKKRRGDW